MSQPIHAPILAAGDIVANIESFRRHLRAISQCSTLPAGRPVALSTG